MPAGTSAAKSSAGSSTPFCIGAGAAAAAPGSELCEPAEPAAKVGAVEGAEKPPSDDDDAIAIGEARRLPQAPPGLRLITYELEVSEGSRDRGLPQTAGPA